MKNSPEELEEMIRHLQTRMVYLEGRVAQLEAGRNPAYIPQPSPFQPNFEPRNNCSKCGMKLDQVMGYVCSSPNCPTFPQVTCGTNPFDFTQPMSGDYYRR